MSQFDLLRSRRFLPLFLTQFLGAFNDNVYKNALVIFIAFALADATSINSSLLVIMAGGIFILPFFLFSSTAGQIADRYEKAMLIRRIKIAEIVIMSVVAVGFLSRSVTILMLVLFLMGAQSTFFGPLKYGILPQHLATDELTGGNGLIQMGTYLAILLGTVLGGITVALDPGGPYVIAAMVLLIAAAGYVASRGIPPAAPADPHLRIRWDIIMTTYRLLVDTLRERGIAIVIAAVSWFWFTGASFLSLVPTYTRDILRGNEIAATLLLTAFSVGIGTGSMLCERLSRGRIEPGLVPWGALGIVVFALDLWWIGTPAAAAAAGDYIGIGAFLGSPTHLRILADFALIGFSGGIYIVPLYAMLQDRCAPERRSRVIAANNIVNALLMVCSALSISALVHAGLTAPSIFLVVALLTAGATGAVFALQPEFLRRALNR